jgi:protoporphyrinogen oxidase
MSQKIIFIGAGPAALTTSSILSARPNKYEVEIFEKENRPGGLAASIDIFNQTVDLGPHRFFTHDKEVSEFWLEAARGKTSKVSRLTRIFYKNKFFSYPLKPFEALCKLGIGPSIAVIFSYLKQKIKPEKNITTFEGWVSRRFGKKLFRIFFKTYSEKLWGLSCKELDADFASQRIKKLSLASAVFSAFSLKKTKHKTLVDEFDYPKGGAGSVYDGLTKQMQENGVEIHFNKAVKGVRIKDNKVLGCILEDGTFKEADSIISTMPIDQLLIHSEGIDDNIKTLAKKLKFRNTVLVYTKILSNNLFPDQWLYIHNTNTDTGRISNFRNWVPELYDKEEGSVLCLEYWCNTEDELWTAPDCVFENMAKEDLKKTGLNRDFEISEYKIVRLQDSYPVYFSGYKEIMGPIIDYLKTINGLHLIGRGGSYKYNNQDHSIKMGLLLADNIINGAEHDLWAVNTDFDSYQEELKTERE